MAATTNASPAPAQPAQQQLPPVPFVRVSELEGQAHAEDTVVFLKSFGGWNRGVSAGFARPRAEWLIRHGYARPFNPRTDRTGFEALVRK